MKADEMQGGDGDGSSEEETERMRGREGEEKGVRFVLWPMVN